jgi:hypothetical protein
MQYPLLTAVVMTHVAASSMAHHSISRSYDGNQPVTVTGVITEFRFVQPHSFLVLDARSGETDPQLWQLEMDNHRELVQIGITADTFRAGDRVIAMGAASRDDERRIYLRQLDRPADGLRYRQIGYRPSIERVPQGAEPQ